MTLPGRDVDLIDNAVRLRFQCCKHALKRGVSGAVLVLNAVEMTLYEHVSRLGKLNPFLRNVLVIEKKHSLMVCESARQHLWIVVMPFRGGSRFHGVDLRQSP